MQSDGTFSIVPKLVLSGGNYGSVHFLFPEYWMSLQLLEKLDSCKVFLPVAEETGCNGSKEADPEFFTNVGYAIQFDSTENDTMSKTLMGVKLYEEESKFFGSVKDIILCIKQFYHIILPDYEL